MIGAERAVGRASERALKVARSGQAGARHGWTETEMLGEAAPRKVAVL